MKSEPTKSERAGAKTDSTGLWVGLGVAFGAALGAAMDDVAIGVALGAALGGTFGAALCYVRKALRGSDRD